jgi:glycosyltransferase involved in cell wall biosynthesis
MKVAVVALYFRPDQAIGSVRPENWAQWISESTQVDVITKDDDPVSDHGVPWRTLRRSGWLMRFVDRLNAWRKQRRLDRQASVSSASMVDLAVGDKSPSGVFTYRMPCLHDVWLMSSLRSLWQSRPDLVIATHSPYVTLLAAWLYALMHPKVKLWVDFRDLWAGNHLAVGVPGFRWLERWLERRILSRASVISTVSDGLADYFRAQGFGNKTQVIYNAPLKQSAPLGLAPGEPLPVPAVLTLCYTGTIYSGWRDPSPLFDLISVIQAPGVSRHRSCSFQVASRNAGNLLELVSHFKVDEYVEFLGALSRSEAMQLQYDADVLVMLESGSPKAKGVLTGKVFEYLATDKPILIIGPGPESELYQLIERHGRLLTLDELRAVLVDGLPLKACIPVDYSEISRAKVQELLARLSGEQECE